MQIRWWLWRCPVGGRLPPAPRSAGGWAARPGVTVMRARRQPRHWRQPLARPDWAKWSPSRQPATPRWRLMQRIVMRPDPSEEFGHPLVDDDPLRRHVLYRISRTDWQGPERSSGTPASCLALA